MTPAEEIAAAAAKIRELASDATPGPWQEHWRSVFAPSRRVVASVAAAGLFPTEADAFHIALWHPGVADAVAALLEHAYPIIASYPAGEFAHLENPWLSLARRINARVAITRFIGEPIARPKRPTVVVLCGSTRFSDAFREANLRETLAGRIVLSIGCDMRSDAEVFADLTAGDIEKVKADLDELHKRKIDLADEVLVLNVGGYVGASTGSEVEYAQRLGKPVRWLEPSAPVEPEKAGEAAKA